MRQEQNYEVLNAALAFALSNLHTNVVCKVTAVGAKTISCKPVVNRVIDGVSIELPEFIEVPPIFLSGGTSFDSYPITIGDSCLLIIAERCFDAWYGGSDFVSPIELRMHDYSDGFALVGVQPLAGAITIPTVATMQGDRLAFGNWNHTGNLDRTGNTNQTGNITASELHAGNGFTGTKTADGVNFVFVDGICIG
tara:strand:- start:7 stop:591 length:585 start_codon:yes stop_codon:yes gene_type:complete